ncbi:MAG: hypothetical protein WEE67_02575 [Chloroflexota bacterium]
MDALAASPDRYLDDGNRITCCWADQEIPAHVRLGDVRRTELPQVERNGRLSALHIARDAGLAEQIHVVGFDRGILGSDFNFYGPRIGRLADLITAKLGEAVFIRQLVRSDVLRRLDSVGEVRLLRMKIDRELVPTVRAVDRSLAEAFDAAFRAAEPGQVELVLRPRPYERGGSLVEGMIQRVRRLAGNSDIRSGARSFEIETYSDGARESIDILAEQIAVTKRIRRRSPRSRALDSAGAYAAIHQAYQESADEIQTAAAVGV